MAAGTRDDGFDAAGGQRFCGDVVRAGAVEDDDGFEAVAISVHERAHTAEIAFALFADVGDEKDGPLRLDASLVERTR